MIALAGPSLPQFGARIVLTALHDADVDRIVEAMTGEAAHRWLDTPWPYSRSDAEGFVREYAPAGWRGQHPERVWAIRETRDGLLAGVISLDDDTLLAGYWLHPDALGHGLASDALRVVTRFAGDCLVWPEVRWRCLAGNVASMHVARAVGFEYVGTSDGVWRDGEVREQYNAVLRPDGVPEALPWPAPEAR